MGFAIDCLFIRDCPGRKVRIGSTHRLPNSWVHGRVVRVDNNPESFSALARRRSLSVKRSLRCHTRRCAENRRFYRFPDRSAGSWLQEARLNSMASLSSPAGPLTRFALGLAEAINHAFGNPREEGAHLPPPWWLVGPTATGRGAAPAELGLRAHPQPIEAAVGEGLGHRRRPHPLLLLQIADRAGHAQQPRSRSR
jgi:hypothetical protein